MPEEPLRYVLGVGYQPGRDPRITKGMDGGRDYFTEAELEKASWTFLADGNPQVGVGHADGTTQGTATVVESYIYRGPDWDLGDGTVITKGTWMIGAILSPKAWQAYQDGHLTGWSLQGSARRRRAVR